MRTNPIIKIPKHQLPQDVREISEILDLYFRSKLAIVKQNSDDWEIMLQWPDSFEYYVDPKLKEGLLWWHGNTPPVKIPFLRKGDEFYQEALNDNWSLYAWSLWLKKRQLHNALPREVVIIHVDDHRDMMSPLLRLQSQQLIDPINQLHMNLLSPSSVENAILSGAIGIGDFITAFLHHMDRVYIKHLDFRKIPTPIEEKKIFLDTYEDDFWAKGKRLQTRLLPFDCKENSTTMIEKGVYEKHHNIEELLSSIPNIPVLLHVDMDAFNNRYNACSDWNKNSTSHDLNQTEVIEKIDELFAQLIEFQVIQKIENIALCLSPGFFPGEYWRESLLHFRHKLTTYRNQFLSIKLKNFM